MVAWLVEFAVLFGENSLRLRQSGENILPHVNPAAKHWIYNKAFFSQIDGRVKQAREGKLSETIVRSLYAGKKSGHQSGTSAGLAIPRNRARFFLFHDRVIAGVE